MRIRVAINLDELATFALKAAIAVILAMLFLRCVEGNVSVGAVAIVAGLVLCVIA